MLTTTEQGSESTAEDTGDTGTGEGEEGWSGYFQLLGGGYDLAEGLEPTSSCKEEEMLSLDCLDS